jgi:YcxB-like protein
MRFAFTLTQVDFIRARRLGTSMQSSFGRLHLVRAPLFGVTWILLVLLCAHFSGWRITNWLIFLPGLIGFVYPLLFDQAGSRMYRRMKGLHTPCSVEFSEEGVTFESNDVMTRLRWKHFTFFAEDGNNFLLFSHGKRCYTIIPKSSAQRSQMEELHTLLATHLPTK